MSPSRSPLTTLLMIVISIVFAVELYISGADTHAVAVLGGITSDTLSSGQWWRLLAAMFLHHGWVHFMLNMWALYQLGSLFELLFGSKRFAITYFVTGIAASIASALHLGPDSIAAGASGAIFGILGAMILSIRRSPRWRHESWVRSLTTQLVGWAGFNIIIGFSMEGIDNWAHIGGFIAGLLLGLMPHRVPPPPPRDAIVEPAEYSIRDSGNDT